MQSVQSKHFYGYIDCSSTAMTSNLICGAPATCAHEQVFVKGLLEEELKGRRYLFRTAADFVAVRGAVEPRPLLERQDFETLRAKFSAKTSQGGLSVVG